MSHTHPSDAAVLPNALKVAASRQMWLRQAGRLAMFECSDQANVNPDRLADKLPTFELIRDAARRGRMRTAPIHLPR
jgi:hypothetical protein